MVQPADSLLRKDPTRSNGTNPAVRGALLKSEMRAVFMMVTNILAWLMMKYLCDGPHKYCFFVIGHDRRKILHFNVTRNPHALWVVQLCRIPDYAE